LSGKYLSWRKNLENYALRNVLCAEQKSRSKCDEEGGYLRNKLSLNTMIPKRNKKQRRNGIYEKDKEG